MAVRSDTIRKFEKQREVLDKVYDRWGVGDEIKGAVSQFIPEFGEWSRVYEAWKVFQAAEILLNVGTRKNPVYGVMKTREEALESLKAEQLASLDEKGHSKPRSRPDDAILRAVAGPDATESKFEVLRPLRKDESLAVVESARQYAGRKDLKARKLKELRDGGINVPDSAIPLARDDRLESIMLALPYIDSLLSADTKYAQLAEKYRELENKFGEMKRSYDALKRWRDAQMQAAIDGVQTVTHLERKLDDIADRAVSAKTNGHPQSGAANGRAEDSAGPGEAGPGEGADQAEPEVDSGKPRASQSGGTSAPATR